MLASRVVGRDAEIGTLCSALDAATMANGRVGFVVGEAGIGKSRLAQVVATDAAQRAIPVLRGRAVQAATPVAYRPLAEALCSAVRAGVVPDVEALAPFRSALGRLVPEWRTDERDLLDDSVIVLAEAVLRFLRAVAGDRGALVVLEDLHWADPETLTLVEYLADNLASERVLCVATLRVEDPSPALDLARALEARRVSESTVLSRLDDGEVADMVRSCLDASAVPDAVIDFAARADGVPFLVEELLAVAVTSGTLVDEGDTWTLSTSVEPVVPLTFADSVRRRLAVLGERPRAVVLAAAVLGRRFDWDLLPAITRLDDDAVLAALHAAVDAQIVAVDPEGPAFRFRHALSQDAVLTELLPPERAALSRRALEAIETAHRGLPGDWCELAAELAHGAGDRRRAAVLLLEVGRRALEGGALASAEAALERARVLVPDDDLTAADIEECLTEVLSLAGKRDRAVEVGASLLARQADVPAAAARRAETYLRLARAAVAATHWDDARAHLEQARTQTSEVADEQLTARIDALDAHAALGEHNLEQASDLARRALEVAERVNLVEVACEALEVLGRCQRVRDLGAAEAAFARAYALASEHDLMVWRLRALHELGTIDLLTRGELTRLEQAHELAASAGALATAAVLDVQIAALLAMSDDPESALAPARRAAALARRYQLELTLAAAMGFEAHVHARAGRRREMEECIQEAMAHDGGSPDIIVLLAFARTILAFVDEDRAEAVRQLAIAIGPASEPAGDQATGPIQGFWALVDAIEGDAGTTASSVVTEEPVHFMARSWLRYAQAVEAGRNGDADRAAALVTEGDLLGDREWFRQYGHRLVAEAAVDDSWGDPVAWLREAMTFFEQAGHDRIASACRSLLRKAGAPVPRRRRTGDADLPPPLRARGITARELEVLQLLAEGLPNREIGARLYLSPRTVERHVANLTVKAGVRRRSELVAFAARHVGGTASLT